MTQGSNEAPGQHWVEGEDDVEGHIRPDEQPGFSRADEAPGARPAVADEDDVEGHIRPDEAPGSRPGGAQDDVEGDLRF